MSAASQQDAPKIAFPFDDTHAADPNCGMRVGPGFAPPRRP